MNAKPGTVNKQKLQDCLVEAVAKGFTESLRITDAGLFMMNSKKIYEPEEVMIIDICRFDQMEDPKDDSVLYQIETIDGKKGILIDAYGSYVNEKIVRFMSQVKAKKPTASNSFFERFLSKLRMAWSPTVS